MLAEAIAHFLKRIVLSYPSFATSTQEFPQPLHSIHADFTIVNDAG